jgi:hypothetical protein
MGVTMGLAEPMGGATHSGAFWWAKGAGGFILGFKGFEAASGLNQRGSGFKDGAI